MKKGMSILTGVLLGLWSVAAPTKGIIGGKHIQGSQETAWVNPYITEGLVAMWDGEWNAGPGVHDANVTVWKDLVGSCDFTGLNAIDRWTDDSAVFKTVTGSRQTWAITNILTMEVVGEAAPSAYFAFCLSGGECRRMFAILPTGNRGFQFANTGPSIFQNWSGARWSVAAIFDNATTKTPSATYYNGGAVATNSGTSIWAYSGDGAFLGYYTTSFYYQGEICCIRVYSRALTAAEVAANYAIDKKRFGLP